MSIAAPEKSPSQVIHEGLDHPVIDADGHNRSYPPLLEDYIREFAGKEGIEIYRKRGSWLAADAQTRAEARISKQANGNPTKNTIDYVTSVLPALLVERMGEMGLDYTVIHPNSRRGLNRGGRESDVGQAMCRAINAHQADQLRPFARHMTPVAAIPMDTPTAAIEELEYAVNVLGMKAIQLDSYARRGPDKEALAAGRRQPNEWWDTLALDSKYDYDSVWQKCMELKVTPGFHSGTIGMGSRTSYSNSVYNHIGHFAAGCEPLCKAMFFGGVTNRFPDLKFAFYECGTAWASALFCDIVGHWKKRNVEALKDLDPANLNYEYATELFNQFADERILSHLDEIEEMGRRMDWKTEAEFPGEIDEFALANIKVAQDIVKRFIPNFFFGCEGDDPMNPVAFQKNLLPMGAQIQTVYGSDISHWDVPDVREVLEEAYELVDEEKITPDNFKDFVFRNPIKLFASNNPDFFKGTTVEDAVNAELKAMK